MGNVAADLRNSGKFNPLDRARLPQQPGSAQEVQPAAWSALGIDAMVVGQVTPNPDGSYNVAYQLVDTGGAYRYVSRVIITNKIILYIATLKK